jgi:hypothetical protein
MADTPDFSKIWGSNGNVTYKFTDDNYLTGWSFVGDTPPARGMFDKFFMGTDTKLKYLYDRLNAEIDKTYTVDDTKAPTSNTEQLLATLSELAHMIKTAGGTSDWKTTPATNLATVATLVSNLASGSDVTWDGKKFTNSKLGITGLMDTNGYIAFGPNFGGLIIQWATENKKLGNDEGTYVRLPIAFPTKYITALLSDTYGRLSNSSAMANQTEGAKVIAVTINSVQIINYWSGGLDSTVTVLAIGY